MWSSPSKLEEELKLDLAVKFSTWPPAQWVHSKAKVGSELSVKIGKVSTFKNYFFISIVCC